MIKTGILYICPTPIGNLEDITLRALRVLQEADLIAAEDTRRTLKLLNHYNIKTPMTSYYEHNKQQKSTYLIEQLKAGKNIALVSDAGTPGISDPGEELVKKALEEGIQVVSLPGPTAITTALVASGLPAGNFFFRGFLPRNAKERRLCLEDLKGLKDTIVLYVAPHRVLDVLEDCRGILGNRKIVLARELTKKYEEFIRGQLSDVITLLSNREIKGEMVLLIEGNSSVQGEENQPWQSMDIKSHILWNMKKGLSKKDAVRVTARERGIPKRQVYAESLDI